MGSFSSPRRSRMSARVALAIVSRCPKVTCGLPQEFQSDRLDARGSMGLESLLDEGMSLWIGPGEKKDRAVRIGERRNRHMKYRSYTHS